MSAEDSAGTMDSSTPNVALPTDTAVNREYSSPYAQPPPPAQTALKRPMPEDEDRAKRQKTEPEAEADDDWDIGLLATQAFMDAKRDVGNYLPVYPQTFQPPPQSYQPVYHPPQPPVAPVAPPPVVAPVHTYDSSANNRFFTDPHLYMRILSIPILESLSTQILNTLNQVPYDDMLNKLFLKDKVSDAPITQVFSTLKSIFDSIKKIYSQTDVFLSADKLGIKSPEHREVIRRTNLATYAMIVLSGEGVDFMELDKQFLPTFVPENEPMIHDSGQLYQDLKTQIYLSSMSDLDADKTKDEILDEVFPDSMKDALQASHPDIPITNVEQEFYDSSVKRREILRTTKGDAENITHLSDQHKWDDFLKSICKRVRGDCQTMLEPYMERHSLAPPSPVVAPVANGNSDLDVPQGAGFELDIDQAIKAASEQAQQSMNYGAYNSSYENPPLPSHQDQMTAQHNTFSDLYPQGSVPYHTQSAPTQVLYEQARQAAVAKVSPHNRRPGGLPSQRRPWTQEEENALMAGLDSVKGPHWSQILAQYGAGGSVSEILKDRNQVQLKDKARNLKLFFLKSNIEVPYYLQCVTGELKTRAPSQAARKEAEERLRNAGDEPVRYNGMMAHSNGMGDSQLMQQQYQSLQNYERPENAREELVVEAKLEPADAALGAHLQQSMERDGSESVSTIV